MANMTITVANVQAGEGATLKVGQAGETITAGEPLYEDSTDGGNLKLCQFDGTAAEADCVGIAVVDAADDAAVTYITLGDLNLGAILTAGSVYGLSATSGSIANVADVASTEYVTVLGVARSATILIVKIIVSGVVVP